MVVKPTRADISRALGGNFRMVRAFEALFEGLNETNEVVAEQGVNTTSLAGELAVLNASIQFNSLAISANQAGLQKAAPSSAWYNFTASQSVPADTWTLLNWSTPNLIVDEIADDMPNGFVDGGKIAAPNRHWFEMRVDVRYSADDADCSYIRFGLRDPNPGGFGVFAQPSQVALLGAGIADEATFALLTFGTDLIPGGAEPVIFADGPITVTSSQAFFARTGAFA